MPVKKNYIKAWAVVRKSDMDIADQIFETRREAQQYFNDTLRRLVNHWPSKTRMKRDLEKTFRLFMARYKVCQVKIYL